MCIIAAKPAGVEMPSDDTMRNMWTNNPDGAGIMYAVNGLVHIEKGFMKYEEFETAIKKLERRYNTKKMSIVMHFRIKTHGEINKECCHPFPVTRSTAMLKKTRVTTKLGIAHNGIITSVIPRKGLSDTMEYVATQLAQLYSAMPQFYKNADALELVENAIDSKMAMLTSKGEIVLIGDFKEQDGIKYSNDSYSGKRYGILTSYYGGYETYGSGSGMGNWKTQYGFNEEYGYVRKVKRLMWCEHLPEGWFISNYLHKSDDFCEDDLAIDNQGNVYVYDYDFDGFEEIGEVAYSANGAVATFDDSKASWEDIIEW